MRVLRAAALFSAVGMTSMLSAQSNASRDVLPFRATETTLANGLKVIVVPTGFPNLVSIQIPVQTGSRNEVEPGKSGLRALLRAPDVPRHAGEPAREVPGDHGQGRRARQREHRRRLRRATTRRSRRRISSRCSALRGHVPAPVVLRGRLQDRGARDPRRIQQEQRRAAAASSSRCSATGSTRSHTYKHTTMGFIKDIENMPNEYAYSKLFFERWYRPQYTTVIIAGDVTPGAGPAARGEVLGRVEGRRRRHRPPSRRSRAPNGPQYVHVPWTSDTLPWVTVAFPGPAFDENGKDSAAVEMLGTLATSAQTSDLYKKLVVTEQKVDELVVDVPSSVDPSLFTVLARVKKAADAVYVRDQILATFARAAAGGIVPVPGRLAGCEVEHPVFLCADARQHRTDRGGAVGLHVVPALLSDRQQLLPDRSTR